MPDLVIAGVGFPLGSLRGVVQTLEPIAPAAQLARTVNGALVDLSAPDFRKYASTISCRDQAAPALSGIWPGALVRVECLAELAYPTATGAPERPVVESRAEGAWTFYRPRLAMRVLSFSLERDDWGAVVGWTMELEEA